MPYGTSLQNQKQNKYLKIKEKLFFLFLLLSLLSLSDL
jgi:hypothetical protein